MACSLRMEAVIFRIKYNTNRGTLFIHFGRSWNTCWCCGEMPTLQLLQSFLSDTTAYKVNISDTEEGSFVC